jgi:glycosyltransferase involved in cell wall biosynthesis
MKIGQISHVYPPSIGGLENYVYRLKQSLENKGNEVTIYTTNFGIDNKIINKEKKVRYSKVDFTLFRNPFSFELIKRLKQSNEDIYHLHAPEFFSSLFATKILKDKPKVMTGHGHSQEMQSRNIKIWLLDKVYHPFAQYILENMDMIIAISKQEREYFLKSFNLSPERIIIIPNGIYADEFKSNEEDNKNFIKKYNLREDSFKILFVSRLIGIKNPHKLIAATNYLKNRDIEIIMIGSASVKYINQLRNIADDKTHILGEVNFKDLVAAYNISNLFVFLGSWGEAMSTVVLEAMGCGLPVLTTPVGGIPDVVTEGENGLFIDVPIDEKRLAEKIEYFMDSDNGRMSKANIAKVNREFNWEIIADQIYDVYKQVLDKLDEVEVR